MVFFPSYAFLENVLEAFAGIFPDAYIHAGQGADPAGDMAVSAGDPACPAVPAGDPAFLDLQLTGAGARFLPDLFF
jgi:hypothetical protein